MRKHKFFQDDIYKLNREIARFTDRGDKKIALSAYNPFNLSVNYFSINKTDEINRWKFQNETHKRDVQHFLDENNTGFNAFLDRHVYSTLIRQYRNDDPHYFLMNLYNNFPVNAGLFFDGIMKKVLLEFIQKGKIVKYAFIDALEPDGNKFRFKYFQWFDMRLFWENKPDDQPSMGVIANQESGEYFKYGNWFGEKLRTREDATKLPEVEEITDDLFLEEYFFRYLLPFFNASTDKDEKIFYGDTLFPMEVRQLSEIKHFLVMPFYDAWIDENPCGLIQGNLTVVPFKGDKNHTEREDFVTKNLKKYTSWSRSVSELLHDSRSHEMLKLAAKEGDDILGNLISRIAYVQDWKRVIVLNKTGEQSKLLYCFKRYAGGKEGNLLDYEEEWNICEQTASSCAEECFSSGLIDFIDRKFSNVNPVYKISKDNKYFYCVMFKDILHSRILPSIESADIARYKNHILCFEFSEFCFFPVTDSEKKKEEAVERLGELYVNRLIPIFEGILLNRKVMKHSVKSAVSAIISRNHSHHIGSHVTPRTSVDKIKERLNILKCKIPKDKDTGEDDVLKVIDGLKSKLDEYIQKKADFMAEISTEPLTTTKTMSFFNEVMLYFIRNSLLMDNIGANEGVNYKEGGYNDNRLRIRVHVGSRELTAQFNGGRSCSCDQLTSTSFPYSCFCSCPDPKVLQIKPEFNDVSVALPGPLGEFAIYSFLENFIRNAVKHNHNYFREDTESYLDIHIKINELEETDPDRDEFYKVEVWDNLTNPTEDLEDLKERLSRFIEDPIVDDYGQLRKGGWGIAEMKIMATLLRGSDDFTTMKSSLRVTGEERLVYEFRMMKPKEVAVISEKFRDSDEHRKHGVWRFLSVDKFMEYQKSGASPASFELVILDKVADAPSDYAHFLPFRMLFNGELDCGPQGAALIDDSFMELIREADAKEIIAVSWQEWIRGLLAHSEETQNVRLALFFGQKKGESPTAEWLAKAREQENTDKIPKLSVIHKLRNNNELTPGGSAQEKLYIFDRHFDGYDCVPNHATINFHEAFDKNSSDFVPIYSSACTDSMICRLAESACLNVLIVDERIAEVAHEEILNGEGNKPDVLYGSKKRIVVSKWANIFIATHLNINANSLMPLHHAVKERTPQVLVDITMDCPEGKEISDVNVYWCDEIKDGNNKKQKIRPDVLIIHQGVLENFFGKAIFEKKTGINLDEFKTILSEFKKFIPYIVVDSGRGIPANLPSDVKFMPFSIIEDYFMRDSISKYSLTRVLMNLTRRGNR